MPRPHGFVEIIVKIEEGGLLRSAVGRGFEAAHRDLSQLNHLVSLLPGARLERSFTLEPEMQLVRNRYARVRLGRRIPSSNLFLRLRLPASLDADEILDLIRAAHGVEFACRASIPGPPPEAPDLTAAQGFCGLSPAGVDVHHAWSLPGGNGAGVKVCDCEYGFDPLHTDLAVDGVATGLAALNAALSGIDQEFVHHGTAVLGILGAKPDGVGVTGLCHGAEIHFSSEHTHLRPDCIEKAVDALGTGDVLLLEMQTGLEPGADPHAVESKLRPAEADPDVHALILEAVGNKVTVVEAAANGGADLADLENADGKRIWTYRDFDRPASR